MHGIADMTVLLIQDSNNRDDGSELFIRYGIVNMT